MASVTVQELSQAAREAGLRPPYVSVVIPVYNTEKQLEECLISALFQTLPETEVVVVNDATPDNAQQIVDRFAALFPDKLRCVIHEVNQGLSGARRTGTQAARAPYVVFLDSDDFVSGRLCELLLAEMLAEPCDMVRFGSVWQSPSGGGRRTVYPPREADKSTLIRKGAAAFWGAMYRRDFLLAHQEEAFRSIRFEDAAATPVLIGLADKVGLCRSALYFYNTDREGSITAERMSEEKMKDLFLSDLLPWQAIGGELRPELAVRVIVRALNHLRKYPEIYDHGVAHLREMLALTGDALDPEQLTDPNDQKLLAAVAALPETPPVPKRVLVNGFMRGQVKDFGRYLAEAGRACLFAPETVVLDEVNCPAEALPPWLREASGEDRGLYFALRELAERGGLYISPAVAVTGGFNKELFSGAFFVAGPDNRLLPAVFGAAPGHPLIKAMVEALDRGPRAGRNGALCDILSLVLLGEGGVHLSGKEEQGLCGLHMLAFKNVCRAVKRDKSCCELDYSRLIAAAEEDLVALPRSLADFAWEAALGEVNWAARKAADAEAARGKSRESFRREKRKRLKAEKRLRAERELGLRRYLRRWIKRRWRKLVGKNGRQEAKERAE